MELQNEWQIFPDSNALWYKPEFYPYDNIGDLWRNKTTYIIKETKPEEKVDTLVDKRHKLNRNEQEKQAIKVGALDEQGHLTKQGRDLLLEILLETNADLREIFYKEINQIYEEQEGEEYDD